MTKSEQIKLSNKDIEDLTAALDTVTAENKVLKDTLRLITEYLWLADDMRMAAIDAITSNGHEYSHNVMMFKKVLNYE